MSRLLVERLDSWSWVTARVFDEVWYVGREKGAPIPSGARRVLFGQEPAAVFKIKRFAVFLAERLFADAYPARLRAALLEEAARWFGWTDAEAFDLYLKKRLYESLIEKVKGRYLIPDALVLGDGGPDIGPLMPYFDDYALEPVTEESVRRFSAEPPFSEGPALAPWPGGSRLLRVGAIAWFVLRRLGRARPEPLSAKYALRWVGPLVWKGGRLHHHFLFHGHLNETGDYKPENIVFVLNPSDLRDGDLEKLNIAGYKYLLTGEPVGIDVRLALTALLRVLLLARFPEPVLQLFQKLLEHEHELSRLSVELYRECAEYSADSILKAACLERRGVTTFNICHGDDFVHTEATCYVKLDRFFAWSRRQLDIFGLVWKGIKKVEVLGPFKNDEFKLPAAPDTTAAIAKAKGRFKVAVFDTSFHDDAHMIRPDVRRMYDDVLWALERVPNAFTLIKSKLYNVGRIFDMEGFRDLGERLAKRDDVVILDSGLPAQEAFKAADLVIAFGPSTAGLEAICCGKDTLFYDAVKLAEHPFLRYPGVVYTDRESLLKRVQELASGGKYMDDAARQAMIDYEGDGRGDYARRFAEAIGARPAATSLVK